MYISYINIHLEKNCWFKNWIFKNFFLKIYRSQMDYIYNYPIQHTLPIAVFLCFITWAGLSGQKYFKSINHLTANLAGMCIGGSFSKCVFRVNRKSKMATIARHTLYGEMKYNFSKRINIWLNLNCSWITVA